MRAASRLGRVRHPRWWVLVCLAAPVACTAEEMQGLPFCEIEGTGMIAVQSVPGAEQIPCFDVLPAGWDATSVRVDQDGVRIHFDSDRAGSSAAVFRFEATCDRRGAVAAPSEFEDAERYDLVHSVRPRFVAERFYVVPGGCFWWRFDFVPGASAALSIELGDRVSLIARRDVNEQLRDTFLDLEV